METKDKELLKELVKKKVKSVTIKGEEVTIFFENGIRIYINDIIPQEPYWEIKET